MSVMLAGVGKSVHGVAWPHIVRGDVESCKFNGVSSKDKLVWFEDNAMVSIEGKPVNCLEGALGEVVCPE